jgi:hypothetical protein
MAYYTVVYRVEGTKAEHDQWWQTIQPMFLAEDGAITVTAVSKDDEMTRLDYIRETIEDGSYDPDGTLDVIKDLIDCADLDKWKREHPTETTS